MDKKYDKQAIKDMLYGTISELTKNSTFYWKGVTKDYSHLTDQGKEQISIILESIIPLIHANELEELDEHSRDLTFDLLKDNKK